MNNKDNPISEAFLAWVEKKLAAPDFYKQFLYECKNRMMNYYSYPPAVIKERLMEKLKQGTRVYGDRSFPAGNVEEELRQEYLDVLGWTLVELFTQERVKR